MKDALILLVLGMGTVLILLFTINLMILVIGKLFGPKPPKAEPAKAESAPAAPAPEAAPAAEDDAQLVAVLTAAACAYTGASPDRIRLVVRPIQTSQAWAQAGRLEQY